MTGDDDDKPKPPLRLAVANDQKHLDREWAKREIERPLLDLAANLIRVVRGAGRSYELARQCGAVVEAFHRYREKVGLWPDDREIEQILSIRRNLMDWPAEEAAFEYASDTIMRGALQVAASRLAGQNTQEQRGNSELMDGFYSLERLRETARKRRLEAERKERLATKPKSRGRKKARKAKPREAKPDIIL